MYSNWTWKSCLSPYPLSKNIFSSAFKTSLILSNLSDLWTMNCDHIPNLASFIRCSVETPCRKKGCARDLLLTAASEYPSCSKLVKRNGTGYSVDWCSYLQLPAVSWLQHGLPDFALVLWSSKMLVFVSKLLVPKSDVANTRYISLVIPFLVKAP